MEKNIAKEKTIGKSRANLLANLNETIQLPRIGVRLLTQHFRISNMVQLVTDTIENPVVAALLILGLFSRSTLANGGE